MKPLRTPEPLTKENFKPILEDIKNVIRLTTKRIQRVIRVELRELKMEIVGLLKEVVEFNEEFIERRLFDKN